MDHQLEELDFIMSELNRYLPKDITRKVGAEVRQELTNEYDMDEVIFSTNVSEVNPHMVEIQVSHIDYQKLVAYRGTGE